MYSVRISNGEDNETIKASANIADVMPLFNKHAETFVTGLFFNDELQVFDAPHALNPSDAFKMLGTKDTYH